MVLAALCCAYLLCYMDRMAIAVALPFIARDLQLSPLAMGGVLSAFFIGYSIMQIPGGMLADKFGPHRVMTGSIIGWSIFTALTGCANALTSLLAIRVLFGMTEGPYPPAASKAVALWFPTREVGLANGIQLASVNIGAAIAPLLMAYLIAQWGWRIVFYSLFAPGVAMALIIWLFIKNPPALTEEQQNGTGSRASIGSFKASLKMPAVFWCCVTLFVGNIGAWGLMNWLPTYLLQARSFDLERTGVFASMPFLAGALGYFLGGHVSDKYFSQKRHLPIASGFLISAGMTYVAAIAPTGELAIAALVIVFLSLFTALGGIFTLPLVFVPSHAVGSTFGLVNTFGQLAALLSPLLIGYVLEATNSDFLVVFMMLVSLFVAASGAATRIRQPASHPDYACNETF